MKRLLILLLTTFLLISSVSALRYRGYLFHNGDCPDCSIIEERVKFEDVEQSIVLRVEDISRGSMIFDRQAQRCGIDTSNTVFPVLVIEDKCIIGFDNIMKFLDEAINTQDVLSAVESISNEAQNTTDLPIVTTGVSKETAKSNTLIFIFIMTLSMIGLVLLGYKLEGKKFGRKNIIYILVFLLSPFISLVKINAFCPVCTVAVGAGLGFAKYLGIDDLISGIWIGGLLLSASLWLIEWLEKKKWKFRSYKLITYILMYSLVIIPFISSGTIGGQYNKFWGMDKVLFGMILGTLGFILGLILSAKLKKKNNEKALFPFQKVVMPITTLILLTLIFYFLVY